MKKTFFLFAFFLSLISFSQKYHLFPFHSNRVYVTPVTYDNYYEIAFDSVSNSNSITTYYNFNTIGNTIESENCDFWGGPICYKQNNNSWVGPKIVQLSEYQYLFFNSDGDTLNFVFDPDLTAPHCFYEDEQQSFYMEFQDSIQSWVLGINQMTRLFKIGHFDANGNPINSPLNESTLSIASDLGLVNFFMVNDFPNQLQLVALNGVASPYLGFNHINQAGLHSHDIGDEIQYEIKRTSETGPPNENFTDYVKHIFLDKWESNDSSLYLIKRQMQTMGQDVVLTDTIIKSYSSTDTLAQIPFQQPDPEELLIDKKLSLETYNDLELITYTLEDQYLIYCAEDNCWGDTDTFGPPPNEKTIYVMGLGLFLSSQQASSQNGGYYMHNKIIYFKKNNTTWGEEISLGDNLNKPIKPFKVFPQPANDYVVFSGPQNERITKLMILDISGKLMYTYELNSHQFNMDLSAYKTGFYIYQLETNTSLYEGKIIIQ